MVSISTKNTVLGASYEKSLNDDGSTENMIDIAGKVLSATKTDGTYNSWMREAFETNPVTNEALSYTLKILSGRFSCWISVFPHTSFIFMVHLILPGG